MDTSPARVRRWTRAEYARLIEAGVFQPGELVELLGGELMVSEPQGSAHYTAIGFVEDALRGASRPALVVEVAESSLALDREHKGRLYAQAGVADYWILNLVDRVLEVYREPREDPAARLGRRYAWTEVLSSGSSAAPLVAPGARISVAELLP